MQHIIIIGGGASGLVAAITAKKENNKVTILEKNSICGKKILITGNGKCNFWNEDQNLNHYHTNDEHLLPQIFTDKNKNDALTFFAKLGIVSKIKNGYFYPFSNQASTIRNALVLEAESKGVEIITNFNVLKITKEKDIFEVIGENKTLTATSVVIATGSCAAPKTGSTGDGYQFLKKFGHTVIKPLPALVQLKAKEKYLKEWAGIRTDVKASLYIDNKYIKTEKGEIQLTDYGISGICIFNLSRYVSIALDQNKKVSILINFLPFVEININDYLKSLFNNKKTIKNQLSGLLNAKLVDVILKIANIKENIPYDELTFIEQEKIGDLLTSFELSITGTNSFNEAQVATGGIPLSEIYCETMESRLVKNLYITGELLNVDGDCGGYNLGFAWISGILSGRGSSDND